MFVEQRELGLYLAVGGDVRLDDGDVQPYLGMFF